MKENFPNLAKELDMQVQDTQKIPKELDPRRNAPRQRNMAQMKEQIKTPEKELSNEEVAKLSDAEFKTLVIRMLTEMVDIDTKQRKK